MQNRSMTSSHATSGLVYSTDSGRTCPRCRQAIAQCSCKKSSVKRSGDGVVRVSRESKGRGGKTVTLVKGILLDDAPLTQLAKQLKAACGSGGTVKDGVIEVQGDHRSLLTGLLTAQGWSVKTVGA
jgi:translation initiation factor 1